MTEMPDLCEIAATTPYPADAFAFVQRGLDHTVRDIHGEISADELLDGELPASRHVSGAQLCRGLRRFAMDQYGLLARTVLRRWHIRTCEDFGRIVFAMVDAGIMHKTDEDTLADFQGVFDFATAFDGTLSFKDVEPAEA